MSPWFLDSELSTCLLLHYGMLEVDIVICFMQCCSLNSPFCLGMTELNCCGTDSVVMDSSEEPVAKKKRLSLSTKKGKKPWVLLGSDRF